MRCICQSGIGYWTRAEVRPLTEDEETEAAEHALAKSLASRKRGKTRTDSVSDKTLAKHRDADLLGARGEKAWSIFWGVDWPKRINDFRHSDFPPNIEVRTTRMDPPLLVLRERDTHHPKRDRRYALIQETRQKTLVIIGWIRPSEVEDDFQPRRLHAYDKGKPARFIPEWSLHRFPFYSMFPKKHGSTTTASSPKQ